MRVKYNRRTSQATSIRQASSSFSQIFKALHYRHEFASRNSRVIAEGGSILKMLGLPLSSCFGGSDGTPTICDAVIEKYKEKSSRRVRRALRTYLKNRGVLPLSARSQGEHFVPPYFFHKTADSKISWKAFNSILRFEAFATAVLGLRRPVMIPMMIIKSVQFANEVSIPAAGLDVMDYDFPLLVDLTAPEKSIRAYLAAMRINMNISHALNEASKSAETRRPAKTAQRRSDGRHVRDKADKLKEKIFTVESIRFNETNMDSLLRIIDLHRGLDSRNRTRQIVQFMSKERAIPQSSEDLKESGRQLFYKQLETAKWFLDNYREII